MIVSLLPSEIARLILSKQQQHHLSFPCFISTQISSLFTNISFIQLINKIDYLEEENLSKTYEIFLNECRYLEESKIYLKRGIAIPKTIHGKTLAEYLVINTDALLEGLGGSKMILLFLLLFCLLFE
jgi:uncharacterized membrane protein